MTNPDKRRGGSHAIRSSASSRNNASVIAPPPRAQLTGSATSSASGGQEVEGAHESGTGSSSNNISSNSSNSSKSNSNSGNKDASGSSANSGSGKGKESALLREKDERIAGLERELAVMEEELMRELDRLSKNESETATFWQRKHSALNQQFLRADTDLRLLRSEIDAREAECLELRDGRDALRRELRARDAEVAELRGHLSGMKQWVSASTRADQQVSDDEFADAAAKLANGLQNWVIVHFRKAKLGMPPVPPGERPHQFEYPTCFTSELIAPGVQISPRRSRQR